MWGIHVNSSDRQVARECGFGFLDVSEVYESIVMLHDPSYVLRAWVGLLVRGRHLLRSAYLLTDADELLDALVLVRALAEYELTLDWLALDPEVHVCVWIADGHRSTFTIDDELRDLADRNRSDIQLRRASDLFLSPLQKAVLEEEVARLGDEIQRLPDGSRRLGKLRPDRMPSLK